MAKAKDPVRTVLADARRAQILDAATHVFAERGFHGATIRQVAKYAGIADGTIYLYFANKDELLLGILNRLNETEQRPRDFERGMEVDSRSSLVEYLRHRFALLDENFEAFRALVPDILANPHLRDRYLKEIIEPSFEMAERFFAERVKQGVVKPVNVRLAVRAVTGVVLGLLVLRMLGDRTIEQEWNQLPEIVGTMILDGVVKESKHEHSRSGAKQKTKTR